MRGYMVVFYALRKRPKRASHVVPVEGLDTTARYHPTQVSMVCPFFFDSFITTWGLKRAPRTFFVLQPFSIDAFFCLFHALNGGSGPTAFHSNFLTVRATMGLPRRWWWRRWRRNGWALGCRERRGDARREEQNAAAPLFERLRTRVCCA